MILTITYTGENTYDISYLFYKNPNKSQVFELNNAKAYVFYPDVSNERTTIALMLDIDPIDLVRGKRDSSGSAVGLFDYVNDRPYVSSSFMSTAISKVFGTAMTGRADSYQSLSDSCLDLSATITMLPCSGSNDMLNRVFEPLGYTVSYETFLSDEKFEAWGESKYVNLTVKGSVRLRDLLNHIYVLITVFDRKKHYWFGREEVDKLLRHGADWLNSHSEKTYIAGRYLNRSRSLLNLAFKRLAEMDENILDDDANDKPSLDSLLAEEKESHLTLNAQRLGSVMAALKSSGATTVIDMGCGGGNLLSELIKERQFSQIAGVDVSCTELEKAEKKLKLDRLSEHEKGRLKLFQASLTYKDSRFEGFDAACVVEVIEHLDINRLGAFERVLFEYAKPKCIVITTPNAEYNKLYENLSDDSYRHGDHRFEWTRREFREWANKTADKYNYSVSFSEIGAADEKLGAPTQMGVFTLCI